MDMHANILPLRLSIKSLYQSYMSCSRMSAMLPEMNKNIIIIQLEQLTWKKRNSN